MTAMKVATCCYCGTRAALTLRGAVRHELTCTRCGAPISRLKMLPIDPARVAAPVTPQARPQSQRGPSEAHRPPPQRPGKTRKTKSLARKLWSGLEDIIDEILD